MAEQVVPEQSQEAERGMQELSSLCPFCSVQDPSLWAYAIHAYGRSSHFNLSCLESLSQTCPHARLLSHAGLDARSSPVENHH